jgi:hypothetical protein
MSDQNDASFGMFLTDQSMVKEDAVRAEML